MIRRSIALVAAFTFTAAGCRASPISPTSHLAPPDQQILRVNTGVEPNSYDPSQQTYTYELAVGRQVFEALLKPRPDLSDVEPLGAASYGISADGLTYTFHLQPGARWSDGKPVTAADWIYGYRHLLNPALAAGYADPFFDAAIAGAQGYAKVDVKSSAAVDAYLDGLRLSAPDSLTFVIGLQRPTPYFKWIAALGVAVPLRQDVVERAAAGPFPSNDTTKPEMWAKDLGTMIGNGPFKISEIVQHDHVTMVPNGHYWAGPPTLEKLEFKFQTATVAFPAYQTGAIDMVGVSSTDLGFVRTDAVLSKQVHQYPGLATAWVAFNTQVPPLDNVKVRLALAKSIDRSKFVANVSNGTATAMESFIPAGMNGYDASDTTQSFDPAAARKLLAESGVAIDQVNNLTLLARNGSAAKTLNEYLADQWITNLGVHVQIQLAESKSVTARLRKGQFDIYAPDAWAADYPDPQDWYDIFVSSGCHTLNWGCLDLPAYDALVSKADGERDGPQRLADYDKAQRLLIDNAVVAFLYSPHGYALVKPYLHITVTPTDEIAGDLNYSTAYVTSH